MKIAKIINNSTAEVKGHFSDVIYFQGCRRNCGYCFNPQLIPFDGGKETTKYEIINSLSDISDVVVITGGEPMYQDKYVHELIKIIRETTDKKIVLETALITPIVFKDCDKVLFTFKTFDVISEDDIKWLNKQENIIRCVVIGHPWFDFDGFKKILKYLKKPLFFRFYNDRIKKFNEVWKIAKMYNVQLKRFDKICL